MKLSTLMKWVSGGAEAVLGFPIVGASIIVGFTYVPLLLMLGLHVFTLFIASREGTKRTGSILGIITSIVGIIPFVGITLHIITAFVLLLDAGKNSMKKLEES
ncbi:hypothetical protein [Pontibacillus marinus]|uniref:Membrane protein n=1 Tax=Pontibacillus marinus BH030004 = DSM 16465 TaxID=1385511 RepID=A0A0A5FZJ2_9BACI|nr:hypothetical protein [Pontibacillus marinus]KGX86256.1 membrane protein [Pontibacillus marinus BH030004 = DSM 16465]